VKVSISEVNAREVNTSEGNISEGNASDGEGLQRPSAESLLPSTFSTLLMSISAFSSLKIDRLHSLGPFH
jgi:hypothetical protein